MRVRLAPQGVRHGHELDGRNREGVGAARGKGSGKISGSRVAIFKKATAAAAGAIGKLFASTPNFRSRAHHLRPSRLLPLRPRRPRARARAALASARAARRAVALAALASRNATFLAAQ